MRNAIVVLCTVLLVPSLAQAGSLAGVWTLPDGKKARIEQAADGAAKLVTKVAVDKKHRVRLVFKGNVAYIKVGTTGGLGLSAHASSFAIRHQGKRCIVKTPKMAVIGDLQGDAKAKRYRVSGWVSGYIHCGGENTWVRWASNVGGTWSASR